MTAIQSLSAHLDDVLEHVDDELEDVLNGDVLNGDGSSPDRLHELREAIRSCQDIVSVILGMTRSARLTTKPPLNAAEPTKSVIRVPVGAKRSACPGDPTNPARMGAIRTCRECPDQGVP